MRWAATMGEGSSVFKILTGKPARMRPLGRSRRRWEVNIRMDFKEISTIMRNWIDSTQYRYYSKSLVNSALNLWVS